MPITPIPLRTSLRFLDSEAAKRIIDAAVKRYAAETGASNRTAEDASSKATDYKKQNDELELGQNLIFWSLVGVVVLLGSVGVFFIVSFGKGTKLTVNTITPITQPASKLSSQDSHAVEAAVADKAAGRDGLSREATDVVDQLVKFAELRANGALTEEEFEEIKGNLIGPMPSKRPSKNDYIEKLRSARDKGDITEEEFHSKGIGVPVRTLLDNRMKLEKI